MKARDDEPDYKLVALLVLALWVCPVTCLGIGLRYRDQIEDRLKGRVSVQVIRPTPFATPTIDWPTPVPTNTPRPTPTSAPTPTLFRPLHLRPWEIDAVAALVAYEALGESLRGQTAVAYTLLHRSLHIGKPPTEILTRKFFGSEVGAEHLAEMQEWWSPENPEIGYDLWQQITLVAINTVNGWSTDEFPTSTHFYSRRVLKTPPDWAKPEYLLGCIGPHCFYSLPYLGPDQTKELDDGEWRDLDKGWLGPRMEGPGIALV